MASNVPKRRDQLRIMAEILTIAAAGALKTQIMYKANLSFEQLTQYLKLLTRKNLLEKTTANGKELYRTTHKGTQFSKQHDTLTSLLK